MRKGARRAGGVVALSLLLLMPWLLAGCGSVRLHDETRAKLAAETKDQYAKADIPGILDAEAKNLDLLLAESVKVSRENHRLQLDFALLSIAADHKPMAETWHQALDQLKAIGFDVSSSTKPLRDFAKANSTAEVRSNQLVTFANFVKSDAGEAPPECPPDLPLPSAEEWARRWNIPGEKLELARPNYVQYASACKQLQDARNRAIPTSGALAEVSGKLKEQIDARQKKTEEIQKQKKDLQDARNAYQKAVDTAGRQTSRCADQEKAISKAAQDAFKLAQKAADKADLSVANEERIRQLLVLLEAAAGGGAQDPAALEGAARVAREIPSLWHDMCELRATGKAPSVGNLLLALRHATLMVDHAAQQRTLADARIALLVRKQALLRQEAEQWLRFLDAFCSYAVVADTKEFPGEACSTFTVTRDGKSCALSGKALNSCAPRNSWAMNLGNRSNKVANRELDKALLAYQRAFALRAEASEVDFRIVDVHHRETLARKQFAVRDWDALVGGGVGQLDAYFAAGIKPAEIADLIVKAVGFVAIAIGIAQ